MGQIHVGRCTGFIKISKRLKKRTKIKKKKKILNLKENMQD
jgi:hypothetical protein